MAKKIIGFIKLQIPAGKANPAPPVGPALGQHGVNIMEFCKSFNAKTQEQMGKLIPAEISVYADRSFTYITKTPPAPSLILEAANLSNLVCCYFPNFFFMWFRRTFFNFCCLNYQA